MNDLKAAAQQALDVLETTISSHGDIARSAINALRAALEQPKQESTWRLSCGCPSHYGGILAEWPETTREGDPAVACGVVCEKHWHEYEARCPDCASLKAQNTELDRKLSELEENAP